MAITNSVYVVSAMCGNFSRESNINPGVYEGLRVVPLTDNSVYGGYGLGQWTNAPRLGVTRRTALVEWLRSNGYADDSGPGQLAFLVYENTWYRNGYGANFNSLSDFLASTSTDVQMLTYAYMQGWEGIWDGTQNQRVQFAYKVLDYIQVHYNEEPGEWIVGNRFLSEADQLHNALLVYNYLTDNEPPDPDPPEPPEPGGRTSKMPIWMYVRYHL